MSVSQPKQPQSSQKARFFIALLPPPDVQTYATELKAYFRDRYDSKAALRSPPHITLQAPFEWLNADYGRLQSALANFTPKYASVPIHLSGFGAFPPRVIYLAVESTPELMALQLDLSHYLAETLEIVDPRSRNRSFRPHLTIAFRDLKATAFRQAWPEFESREVQFTFSVQNLTLLMHTGQCWEVNMQFPMT
ncbi:MAG: 2'-5' RNA ligase family protein [Leptolyngbya sp. SIO1D8]|nr:2'-5' RNA ligase family protein [Leptolyngbya sp. SIO1D8]